MARLAPIQYRTGVQSLGRHDVSQPAREFAAESQVIEAAVSGVQQIERAAAASEYTRQMSDARNSINELYNTLFSKEAFRSSEVPEFVSGIERYETIVQPDGSELVQERIIPATEIREAWFKQGMQNIINSSVQTSNTTARSRISQELRTAIGPAAYNQMMTANRAAQKQERLAILDAAVQKGVLEGDRLGVEQTLYRFLITGEISKKDYEVRKLTASQDLDIEAYSQEIFAAEDESELEELYARLGQNDSLTRPGESDMTVEQRRFLRQSVDRQQQIFDDERKERHVATEQDAVVRLNDGRLTKNWITTQLVNDNLERAAAMSLLNAMEESGSRGTNIREGIVNPWRRRIQLELYRTEFGIQTSELAQNLKSEVLNNGVLNGREIEALIDYVTKVEKQIRDTPEMRTAITAMKAATGMPEGEEAFDNLSRSRDPTAALIRKAYAEFEKALYNYVDEFGVEASPLEFVERNKDRFDYLSDPDKVDEVENKVMNSRFKAYRGGDPVFNPDITMRNAWRDFLAGDIEEEDVFDLWNILYGTAVDIDLLENM